jgi:hypothetical protein
MSTAGAMYAQGGFSSANGLTVTSGTTAITGNSTITSTTSSPTVNIATGVLTTGTKTVNIGTAATGGTTNITLGTAGAGTNAITLNGPVTVAGGLISAASQADFAGVYTNNTTGIDSVGIVVTSGRLRRISSSQKIKYDMYSFTEPLSSSILSDKIGGAPTVNPADVLNLSATEFSLIDEGIYTGRRVLGFIADDVADKFPIAATKNSDGEPAGVLDTAILASLLVIVKELKQEVEDLRDQLAAFNS